MIKPTKWHVCPVTTRISLGIGPVWSVFAVCMKNTLVLSYLQWHSEDFDQTGWMQVASSWPKSWGWEFESCWCCEYCKIPNHSDTQKIAVIILTFEQRDSTTE